MMISQLHNLRIRTKLTLVMLLTVGAAMLLVGSFVMKNERSQARDQMRHELATITQVAYAQIQAALVFSDLITLQESANSLDFNDTVDIVCLYDAGASLLVYSNSDANQAQQCPQDLAVVESGFRDNRFIYKQQLYSENNYIGSVFISANLDAVHEQINRYFYIILTAFGVVAVLSIGIAILLQKAVTQPIAKLAETATKIAAGGDYSVRAKKISRDEIGTMVDSFNIMLDAIEQRDNELTRHKLELESRVSERTAELQASNKELEAFSYPLSHDLRAPLRAIDGFSLALLEDYSLKLGSEGRSYLERVRMATQRMGVLIDCLLSLSNVTRQEIVLTKVDLSQLCRTIMEELQDQYWLSNTKVIIQPDMSIRCDAGLARVMMSNLLGNACKYTKKTESAKIEVGCEEGVFYVKDNGAGFDMRHVEKLFGAFQRLHRSEEFEGTGIGLATVSRIVKRHGGEIWANAKPGKGATFYFTFP